MNLSLRIPPVVVVLACAALQWLLARTLPAWPGEFAGRGWIAAGLFALGTAVAVSGVVSFRRARTTVNPMNPSRASALVDNGIYRYTRNPMYLGFAIWLLGWSVLLGSVLALAGVFVFVWWMNRYQIAPEERALQGRFGEAFTRYRRQVRRWL